LVTKWWRKGLSSEQAEALEREANVLFGIGGIGARDVILQQAKLCGRAHFQEGFRLSRLAACIADLSERSAKQRPPRR